MAASGWARRRGTDPRTRPPSTCRRPRLRRSRSQLLAHRERDGGPSPFADGIATDLEHVRAGEVRFRPEAPGIDALVWGQIGVGGSHDGVDAGPGVDLLVGRAWLLAASPGCQQGHGARRHDHGLDAPRSRLQHDGLVQTVFREHVLDVLGEDIETVGQDDDVPLATDQDQAPSVIEAADVAAVVPALGIEGRGGRCGVLPVARADGGTCDEGTSASASASLSRTGGMVRPTTPARVVALGVAGGQSGLGGAVALHDGDAQVLPALLQFRWQPGAGGAHHAELATELAQQRAEDEPAEPDGQMAHQAPRPFERRHACPAARSRASARSRTAAGTAAARPWW